MIIFDHPPPPWPCFPAAVTTPSVLLTRRCGDPGFPASSITLMIRRVISAGVPGPRLKGPPGLRLPLIGVAPDPNPPTLARRTGSATTSVRGCRGAAHGVPWLEVAACFHTRAPPGVACANELCAEEERGRLQCVGTG